MSFVAPVKKVGPTLAGAAILCSSCGGPRSNRSKTGLCFSCAMKARKPKPRFCSECGVKIYAKSKLGLCRQHVYSSAEFQRRRTEAIRRAFENPEHREKMRKVIIRNHSKAMLRPEFMQWMRENGERLGKILQSPEMRARTNSPECRARLGRAVSEARMKWCPEELRDEYRHLIRSKRMHSSEAKKIILGKMDELRAIRHPFFEDVLHFMRRLTAVLRLDNGNYRVGITELTPGQLLKRAESKGYTFERMAA